MTLSGDQRRSPTVVIQAEMKDEWNKEKERVEGTFQRRKQHVGLR